MADYALPTQSQNLHGSAITLGSLVNVVPESSNPAHADFHYSNKSKDRLQPAHGCGCHSGWPPSSKLLKSVLRSVCKVYFIISAIFVSCTLEKSSEFSCEIIMIKPGFT